jgi:hypothetical protein
LFLLSEQLSRRRLRRRDGAAFNGKIPARMKAPRLPHIFERIDRTTFSSLTSLVCGAAKIFQWKSGHFHVVKSQNSKTRANSGDSRAE